MAYIQDWGMRVQAQPQINTTRRAFLHLSQNENGRMLNIRITDVDIPTGSTAVLAGTKPDGTVYSQSGTLAGNTATFAEDVQMTAVAGTWDAKITVTNGGNCICTARITITIDPDTVAGGAIPSDSQLDGIIAECRAIADSVRKEAYGSPLTAATAAAMTDQSRVYVYTGSESGMTAGHWYYYDGSSWADGGVYNAVAVDTDTTLTIAGKAADDKKVGDELADVKEELNAIPLNDWIDGYYYNGASSVTNIKPTDTKTSAPAYSCMVVDCFADDVFYLTGKGGSGAKLWLWTKNNGDVISRAASNATAENLRLTPPNDAQYLYIAIQNEQPHSLTKVKSVDERISDTIGDLLGAEKVESWVRYKYIKTNGTTVDVNSLVDGYANSYVILSCSEGDTFVVTGTGGSGARLYCFTDSSYNVLAKASSSYVTANEVIIAPADTAYLIVNVNHYRYYALYKLQSNSFGTLLNGRVAVLENAVDALPDYLEDEAQDTADKIKNACTEGAYVIGFVTDSHYGISNSAFTTNWGTTAKTLKRVNELRRFDMLIHGGDMADGNAAKADTSAILSRFVSDLRGINPDAMMLSGNHDDNLTYYKANGTGFISRAERRAIYANGCEGTRFSNYAAWYKDIPWLGLRIIGLDYLMDDSTYAEHSYWGFTTEQIEWVRDTALNTSNQVVFFSHGPCTTAYGYGRDGSPITIQNGDTLRGVIETFIANGGTVVGLFHGHTHWDFIGQYSQTNGFREVSTGRSVMDTWTSANITYSPQGIVFEEKTADTVTQELWDVIVIKPQSRTVSIIRYGAGSDRTFTY